MFTTDSDSVAVFQHLDLTKFVYRCDLDSALTPLQHGIYKVSCAFAKHCRLHLYHKQNLYT